MIKIERPGDGDFARRYDTTVLGQSSYFVWLNRSKESLTLDVKTADGVEILHQLLASADVFVQNLAPGASGRLGLDPDSLAQRYARLIVCDVSGYGATGPWADRKAYDLLVQGEVGLMSLTGPPGSPSRAGISVADIAAGVYAYSGILSALYQRAVTGKVSAVHVSLFESLAEWMGSPAYYTRYGGKQPPQAGAEHATIAPYGPFVTADGYTIIVAVQNEREWVAPCSRVLGDDTLATDPRFVSNSARVVNRVALNELISFRLGRLTVDEAARLLDEAAIANGRMNSVQQLLDHPSLAQRDRWRSVDTPAGAIEALIPPADLHGVEARMGPVPAIGQHSESILTELGLNAAEIADLKQRHVV